VNADAVVAVSAAVVALTQLSKWAGLRDSYGPIAVILISGVGVLVWLVGGEQWPPARTDIWPIFSGWIAVTLSAAGVFGFTRAAAGAVTRATPPPNEGDAITEAAIRIRAKRLEREHPNALVSKPPQWLPPTPRYGASSVPQLSDDEIVRRHEALG
jgi:peptidoglycan/LPS O-acetylase OafA/YrhL